MCMLCDVCGCNWHLVVMGKLKSACLCKPCSNVCVCVFCYVCVGVCGGVGVPFMWRLIMNAFLQRARSQ